MSETIRAIDVSPVTERGKEVQDVVNIMLEIGTPKSHIHAALLGMAGVSTSCWPEYLMGQLTEKVSIRKDREAGAV